MEVKHPVYWHQGLYLQPQHFELSDLHGEFLLKSLMQAGIPHFWGISALEITEAALGRQMLEVRRVEVLFRDGTYVEYPGNALLRPRPFNEVWTDQTKPLTAYIGLKRLTERERNVAVVRTLAETPPDQARFITAADPEDVADLYAEGPAAKVRRLSYVLRIFWESEVTQLEGYETVPIARLERDGDKVVLSPSFIPPCFALGGSERLLQLVQDLRDELAARTHQLEQYKSPRELQKAEFDSSFMVYLLALRTLNRYVPLLFHYAETRQLHPWALYGLLRQLIGELSSFSERYSMLGESNDGGAGLLAYSHEDLGRCLLPAVTLVQNLLNDITIGPEFVVQLKREADVFRAELPKGFFGPRNRHYLILRSETEAAAVIESFEAGAKMGAPSVLPLLISRSLPGVELIHMPVAAQGLPRRSDSCYFRVESLGAGWREVESEGAVALYWGEAPEDIRVDLVVLRG